MAERQRRSLPPASTADFTGLEIKYLLPYLVNNFKDINETYL